MINTYDENYYKRKYWYIMFIFSFGILLLFIYMEVKANADAQNSLEAAFVKGNSNDKHIALTFNISWGEEKVYDILNVLEKEKVQTSFFVSGEWAERHPQIVNEITEREHELGMLGYRYKNYIDLELDQVRKDVLYAKEIFRKLGFKHTNYIRPPSGLFNKEIIELIENLGLTVIHWSINTDDWKNPGIENIVDHAKKASNGDIILMHASDSAKQTAEALETIIPYFKDKGYSFVTVSELENDIKIETKLIE